jgi:hypothetical protein
MTNKEIDDYKSYLGNQNLKKSGVKVNWTKDLIKEYAKCQNDPIYFIQKYIKVINIDQV